MSEEFKMIAQEHGCNHIIPYNQGIGIRLNWRQLIPESQGGVCAGLALIWLASRKAGLTNNVFGDKYSQALYKFAEHAAEKGADNSLGQNGIDVAAMAFSLKKASARLLVTNNGAAKWISNGVSPLVLMGFQNHAVAIHVQKPVINFFDPNHGVATFPTTLKFATFLPEFLRYAKYNARFLQFYK